MMISDMTFIDALSFLFVVAIPLGITMVLIGCAASQILDVLTRKQEDNSDDTQY
jgi:hypothetical protein